MAAPNLHPVPNSYEKTVNKLNYSSILSIVLILLMVVLTVTIRIFNININNRLNELELNTKEIEVRILNRIDILSIQHSDNIYINNIYLKIHILNNDIDHELAKSISESVYKYSNIYKRDPDLLLSLIKVESNFNPKAISFVGAEGLTQIMPFWKEIFRTEEDFFEIETSIKYSLQILSLYEKQYGELEMALIAYNRGNHQIESSLLSGKDPRNGYAKKIMDIYSKLKEMDIGK